MTNNDLHLEEHELYALKHLQHGYWKGFFLPGGEIDDYRLRQPGVYSITYLTIDAGSKVTIDGLAVDIVFKEEVFRINVYIDKSFGDEQIERRNRPRRKLLEHSPPDIALENFIDVPLNMHLLRKLTDDSPTLGPVYVDAGLLITSSDDQLIIVLDERISCNILVSTSLEYIDSVLHEFKQIEIPDLIDS